MNADEAVTATFLQPGHGTLTTPVPKTRRHRQIRAEITMGWRWNAHRTVLTRVSFSNLPATARILATCKGKRCPFKTREGTERRIKAFEHRHFTHADPRRSQCWRLRPWIYSTGATSAARRELPIAAVSLG
jgi:hypothetical protein